MKIAGYRVKDLLSVKKWISAFTHFVGGKYIFIKKDEFNMVAELYIYRRGKCTQCFEAGKCVGQDDNGCGCPFLGLATGLGEECGLKDNPQWEGETKESWEAYKEETGLRVIATRR